MGEKLSYSYVKEYIESYGYQLISDTYVNSNKKLSMICKNGHECSSTFGNFKNKDARCKHCANDRLSVDRRHSFEYVQGFIENYDYTLISEDYKNGREAILFRCPDGHEYEGSFSNFKAGKRCSACELAGRSAQNRRPIKEVEKMLSEYGYILLSKEYVNAREKIDVRCPEGHDISIVMGHFKRGRRCSKCILEPRGETATREFLENNNVSFSCQVKFDGCRDKRCLSFDFHIPEDNVVIEIQGRQHYEPVGFFGGKKNFKSQQRRDNIKRAFCRDSGMRLVEIPYWDFEHIEEILTEELFY